MSFNDVAIILEIEAFSVNRMTYRDVRFKSKEYKDWATKILYLLSEEKALIDLAARWKEHGGVFKVTVSVEYPKHVFFNKQGDVSSKTVDCTNVGKPLIDLIFGQTMDVNDKYIVDYTELKRPGSRSCIKIYITLLGLDYL